MDGDCQTYPALLGAGGENPRVEIINSGSQTSQKVLRFPPSHSVYALDINLQSNLLAVGTKGGLIYILEGLQDPNFGETALSKKMVQGAPVLSVCWVNKYLLAASDTAGRCFLWYVNNSMPPQPLVTINGVICCLSNLKDGFLVGLSSGGTLHCWEPIKRHLTRTIDVPPPPPISGLVRMVYWPTEGSIVFPAQKGCLTLYNISAENVVTLAAHKGEVYALSVWGEDLMTADMTDGQLKIWSSGVQKPVCEFQVFKGITSIAATGVKPSKLLLVESGGTAVVFSLERNSLQPVHRLTGKDYRVAFAPSPESIKLLYDQQRLAEARQLANEIYTKNSQASPDVIKSYYSRLNDLGFEHISLALQAEQATKKEEIVESLRIRSSLLSILPQDVPNAFPSMEKYADLLEKAWHIPEAYAVYQQILSIDPVYPLDTQIHNLKQIVDLLSDQLIWVIEPDITIDQIIQSATVIGKRFVGRYVIKKLNPVQFGHVKVSSDLIVRKYEQIRFDSEDKDLPPVMKEHIWWISRKRFEQVELLTFGNGLNNPVRGLQFALEVITSGLGIVVIPAILFDWRDVQLDGFIEEENEKASKRLADIVTKVSASSYLALVHKVVHQALRRILTENILRREFRG
jgi:hypothetical protein